LVRIDWSAFSPSPPKASRSSPIPNSLADYRASAQTLQELVAPTPPETLSARRQLALGSIRDQREAIRQNLLQTRLAVLAELEPRWRAELQSEYDTDALLVQQDREWFEAFQAYGQARFPLLVALLVYAPDSAPYRTAQQSLRQLEREWQANQRALQERYQAQLNRIEQEIEVRLNSRRRAFTQEVTREVDEAIASQPRAEALYLPPIERLEPAPARKQSLPSAQVRLNATTQVPAPELRVQSNAQFAERTLRQLADQWAHSRGYQLTENPNARDATQEFAHYLQGR